MEQMHNDLMTWKFFEDRFTNKFTNLQLIESTISTEFQFESYSMSNTLNNTIINVFAYFFRTMISNQLNVFNLKYNRMPYRKIHFRINKF